MNIIGHVSDLKDADLRNLMRGARSNKNTKAKYSTLDHARRVLHLRDAHALANLMCSTDLDELYFGSQFPATPTSLYTDIRRREIQVEIEASIQASRLRANLEGLLSPATALGQINSEILSGNLVQACRLCEKFIEQYGYSAVLARKAIYIYSKTRDVLSEESEHCESVHSGPLLSKFLTSTESTLYSQYVNLALDICDVDAPNFEVMREHRRILERFIRSPHDTSKHLAMMRRLRYPTHYYSIIDSVSLLLFSSATALDLLIDLCVASYCDTSHYSFLSQLFGSPAFVEAKAALQPTTGTLKKFLNLPHSENVGEACYKAAFAFSEVRKLALWRRSLDFELSCRDHYIERPDPAPYKFFLADLKLLGLCKRPSSRMTSLTRFRNRDSDTFLRTLAVLRCLRSGERLSELTPQNIRLLLSITTGFARILTEDELLDLKMSAEREDANVIIFLTMVMLNEKNPSEDLAFEMRLAFQNIVRTDFDSDILVFLEWLHARTPGLSHVIVELCDITFLERLYLLHSSYSSVLAARQRICKWAAQKLGRAYYLVVAERLALDSKVRRIRGEIDDNRIFVDAIRYEQWAIDTLTPMLRKFERVISVVPGQRAEGNPSGQRIRSAKDRITVGNDYWFSAACQEAFREFCHNRIFGIDSYLSRRIRHGTLAGTLIVPVQNMIKRFQQNHEGTLTREEVRDLEECLTRYKRAVYYIRDGLLHFRSNDHPEGLLLPYSMKTQRRLRLYEEFKDVLVEHFQVGFGPSELSSLFSDHCWELMTEDLVRVQDQLRIFFHGTVRPVLRAVSAKKQNRVMWRQLSTELDQRAEVLFSDLSGWFTRSEGATMTVTVRELLNVVVEETGNYWPRYRKRFILSQGGEERLFGATYQNVYDILSVLFSNIAQHGNPEADTLVSSVFAIKESESGNMLRVCVTSAVHSGAEDHEVRAAMAGALNENSQRDPMVIEGRSGLGKARALVESYSDGGEFKWYVENRKCRVEFRIPIILVGG